MIAKKMMGDKGTNDECGGTSKRRGPRRDEMSNNGDAAMRSRQTIMAHIRRGAMYIFETQCHNDDWKLTVVVKYRRHRRFVDRVQIRHRRGNVSSIISVFVSVFLLLRGEKGGGNKMDEDRVIVMAMHAHERGVRWMYTYRKNPGQKGEGNRRY
jgi:hypothetical protein